MTIKDQRHGVIFCIAVYGWILSAIGIFLLKDYAFGIFMALPTTMGILTVLLSKLILPAQTFRTVCHIAWQALLVYAVGLLLFAIEGIICIIMASPIVLLFLYFGVFITEAIINFYSKEHNSKMLAITLLLAPLFMGFEHLYQAKHQHPIHAITTTIDIKASPEAVWANVVDFSELPPPDELLFQSGIAYPIKATIKGSGVGAIRYCHFSTGSFVEPITVWEENRLLQFDVAETPEPMKELSLYDIHPQHLHGYFVSVKGQFRLIPLPDGSTRLEGTTWYYNKIQPTIYWNLWSDYIVHAIHRRVLKHIKVLAEQPAS